MNLQKIITYGIILIAILLVALFVVGYLNKEKISNDLTITLDGDVLDTPSITQLRPQTPEDMSFDVVYTVPEEHWDLFTRSLTYTKGGAFMYLVETDSGEALYVNGSSSDLFGDNPREALEAQIAAAVAAFQADGVWESDLLPVYHDVFQQAFFPASPIQGSGGVELAWTSETSPETNQDRVHIQINGEKKLNIPAYIDSEGRYHPNRTIGYPQFDTTGTMPIFIQMVADVPEANNLPSGVAISGTIMGESYVAFGPFTIEEHVLSYLAVDPGTKNIVRASQSIR